MKLQFWAIGKNNEPYVKTGVEEFTKRIANYFKIEWNIIPVPKNAGMLSEMDLKKKEGEMIFEWISKDDYLVALDERGKQFSSKSSLILYRPGPMKVQRDLYLLLAAHLD